MGYSADRFGAMLWSCVTAEPVRYAATRTGRPQGDIHYRLDDTAFPIT
jgi:hypothetical protein